MSKAKRFTILFLALLLAVPFWLPAAARAEQKTVRVGWHDDPYFITDQFGRNTGYSYEFQMKVAAYTGWTYEYVKGTWPELLQMLKDGQIDMLSDVSFLPARAEEMLFASLPMGSEAYYLFVSPDNTEIKADDYSTLNGKKVGVTRSTIQEGFITEWITQHGLQVELVGLNNSEEDSMLLLQDGTLDAYVTMDVYANRSPAVPVWKIGSSDFYFAVSQSRPELLMELNTAMSLIQDEDPYFEQQLHEKFLSGNKTNQYLSVSEKRWLGSHGTIRVGYQENYLAFCGTDPATGKLTGALKDYLDIASTAFDDVRINFEAVAYPTAAAALEALQNGEIDCMFPANLSSYDGEQMGLVMTPAMMRTEMDAVVRGSTQKEFIRKSDVAVAVNEGNTNYDMFLADHFPGWTRMYFPDTLTGLDAVADGKADCVIISNYRFSNISRKCEKLHLTTVYTGVDMDYCLAVRKGDTELYSILSRLINIVPDAAVNAALTYYSTEDVKTTFTEYVKDNLFIVMSAIALILLIILILLLRSIRAERKAREEEHQIRDLNRKVFVDALTHVRNKGAFDEYVQEMQGKLDKGKLGEFAIGIFDCDDLKKINDQNGHDKGNEYLKAASRTVCKVFQHSPVFRIGGDEFAVVLQNDDFRNREELVRTFEETKKKICDTAENMWDEVHIAMGIAVYDPEKDDSVNDTVRRADRAMYENKREGKQKRS